jgi:Tfp pilus assembly pilus retraction ATPase PilT
MQFEEWIEQAYSLGASDLHLEADTPIVARIRGELQTVGANVSGATLEQVARDLLGEQWPQFIERGSADHAESIGGIRLRVNFFPSRICASATCTGICASSSSPRAVWSSSPDPPGPANRRRSPRSSRK